MSLPFNPETTNPLFNRKTFEFMIEQGRQLFEGIALGHHFYLYKLDRNGVQVNKMYGSVKAENKSFTGPYELVGSVNIVKGEPENIAEEGIFREIYSEGVFCVYSNQLLEKGVDVVLGDVIGFSVKVDKMEYFEVVDPNYISDGNKQTIGRIDGFYRKIKGKYISYDIFLGDQAAPPRLST